MHLKYLVILNELDTRWLMHILWFNYRDRGEGGGSGQVILYHFYAVLSYLSC